MRVFSLFLGLNDLQAWAAINPTNSHLLANNAWACVVTKVLDLAWEAMHVWSDDLCSFGDDIFSCYLITLCLTMTIVILVVDASPNLPLGLQEARCEDTQGILELWEEVVSHSFYSWSQLLLPCSVFLLFTHRHVIAILDNDKQCTTGTHSFLYWLLQGWG